ncbi:hypothetical protein B0A48_17034 [Cryoendolithus antarcticus]|uniref:Outer spore wall protein RRT8 n=1 Tax=Cryoendolithus antarcticus TaxID=1507870 RepID=A0A1V8SBN0_9PEZI|nr:hypothetical protein B0A48_17034 [Cryoendolithus antarcticus]OQO32656.1 hypothetical protein B0A51_00034 [Rachicladosporium sp. CCFEE 5018]
MAARVKETAVQEAEHLRQLTEEGVKSGAYIYPIRGIYYYLSHRDLWSPLTSKLVPTITTGLGVTTFMFVFTYLPQAAIMAFTSGPLAALSAALLVLSESSTLTMVLSKALLIEDSLIDTFDGTLMSRGQSELVARERTVKSGGAGNVMARLGKLAGKPFAKFTPQAIIRYFMFLPLNLIPIVGTIAFVVLQGRRTGPQAHNRYYQLKGMDKTQREQAVEKRKAAYASFGIVAVLLEMIPIAGIFFAYTNTVGAALWAADLEQKGSTAPALREQAKKAS